MASLKLSQILDQSTKKLKPFYGSARLDAEVLVAHALGFSRTQLYTWSDNILSNVELINIDKVINRRSDGEPVAYIVGTQEFWSLNFKVTPDTLIPRPETELLVEFALEKIPADRPFRVLDLGTGSGAIAIAIAKERPNSQVKAVDQSQSALTVAIENAKVLAAPNVTFEQGDWFDSIGTEVFDIIISNPPYIESGDRHLSEGDVASEPRNALISGADGLDDIRKIISQAKVFLSSGAALVFEHGWDQSSRIRKLFSDELYENISSHEDLAGIERITAARNNKLT